MYICNKCLSLHYNNQESMVKKAGECELCHSLVICNDIPTEFLKPKNKIDPEVSRLVGEFYSIIARRTNYTLADSTMRELSMDITRLHLLKLKEFQEQI